MAIGACECVRAIPFVIAAHGPRHVIGDRAEVYW